jgi:hypothetical protein
MFLFNNFKKSGKMSLTLSLFKNIFFEEEYSEAVSTFITKKL